MGPKIEFVNKMAATVNKRWLSKKKIILLVILRRRLRFKESRYKKRFWIRKLFVERETKAEFNILVKDSRLFDIEYFFTSFRMTSTKFEKKTSGLGGTMDH